MKEMILNNGWKLKVDGFEKEFDTTVPGSVYDTLIKNEEIPDPYWRDNEMEVLPIMDGNFEYSLEFSVDSEILSKKNQVLKFDGIDTIAEVILNDQLILSANNMHREWEVVVGEILKEVNLLIVKLYSPTKYIEEANKVCVADGSSDAMVGFPHLRKAYCMFGWDWGPRLPDAGLWRKVVLYATDTAVFDSVLIKQNHTENQVDLTLEPTLKYACEGMEYTYKVEITNPLGEKALFDTLGNITIENPMKWWPNGYGEQNLYEVEVQVYNQEILLDTWARKIGLRTLIVNRDKDEWGEKFEFTVNGYGIFSMGADYIPEDNILARVNEERTRVLLEDCVKANYNTIRVWGGGYYPDDFFFDLCDELGLVVWQDFMIACAVCELTEEFEETLLAELVDNVKRLRHHPSLGIWCGNNENEWLLDHGEYVVTNKQRADYLEMFQYLFPKVVKAHDPERFYWPSSPSSGGFFEDANDFNKGDVHYWEVWHGNKPFSDYRNYHFRYASEFGFQSFPSIKTVKTFTEEKDRNVFSYIMEKHQRNKSANGKILTYLSDTYLYPNSFEDLIYASQLLQAEAIKYGVEHWRRYRGRCMGAIYWQVNDCWPVTSWASIDYDGRWKALHYYAKRFFAPVLLSCCEEGTITQGTNVNAQFGVEEQSAKLSVSNETMKEFTGSIKWAIRNNKAEVIQEGTQEVKVDALSSVWFDKMDFSDLDAHEYYMSYDLYEGEEKISGSTVFFCQPKHYNFADPHLQATVNGDEIVITADAFAKSVEIDCEDTDMVLSDNYFDMNAGTVVVKLEKGTIGDIVIKSVYDLGK
ncbi:MAG: glycoside hydrolase family 2 protein [Eubacteriales bacterium]